MVAGGHEIAFERGRPDERHVVRRPRAQARPGFDHGKVSQRRQRSKRGVKQTVQAAGRHPNVEARTFHGRADQQPSVVARYQVRAGNPEHAPDQAAGSASASICPLIGATGTRASEGTPSRSPAQAPVALTTALAATKPSRTRTPRRAGRRPRLPPARHGPRFNAARFGCSGQRTAETAIIDLPFARKQGAPDDTRAECGSSRTPRVARATALRLRVRGPRTTMPANAALLLRRMRRGGCRRCASARRRRPRLADRRHSRIECQRAGAERLERRSGQALRERREHAGCRPRGGASGFVRLDDPDLGTALGQLVGNAQTDQAPAQDDDHRFRLARRAR